MKSLFLAFSFILISLIANAQWEQTSGPTGSWTNSILKLSGHLFVNGSVGSNGGIFRSDDDGETWVSVNNGLHSKICYVMTTNGQDLFVSDYQAGIYKSSDLGATWTFLGLEGKTFYSLLAIDHEIYAGWSDGGFYYSADDGKTWTLRGSDRGQVRNFVYLQNTLFVGFPTGVYKSTDKGVTLLQTGLASSVNFLVGSGTSLYAAPDISTDLGDTWTIFLQDEYITAMAADGGKLYAAAYSKFFVSDDNGVNWTTYDDPGYFSGIASLFVDNGKLYGSGKGGFFVSTDGGATWVEKTNGLRNEIVQHIAATSTKVLAGSETGIYISSDNGGTWSRINNGLYDNSTQLSQIFGVQIKGIHASANGTFIATSRGVYALNEDGQTWTPKLQLTNNSVFTMAGNGPRLFVHADHQYYSPDNGANWTTKSDPLLGDYNVQAIVSGDTIVCYADDRTLLSTNFGETWSDISMAQSTYGQHRAIIINKKLFLSSYSGLHAYSFDNQTWTQVFSANPVTSLTHIKSAIYIGTDAGVLVSYNMGQTWYPTGTSKVQFYELGSNDTYMFGGTYGESAWRSKIGDLNIKPVIKSYKGVAEIEANKSLTIALSDLEITDPDSSPQDFTLTIVPGTNYTADGNKVTPAHNFSGQLQVAVHVSDGHSNSNDFTINVGVVVGLEDETVAVRIYPNPATKSIYISTSITEYKIRDITGREVLHGGAAGTIDISTIAPGSYLLEMYGTTKSVHRFVKIEY